MTSPSLKDGVRPPASSAFWAAAGSANPSAVSAVKSASLRGDIADLLWCETRLYATPGLPFKGSAPTEKATRGHVAAAGSRRRPSTPRPRHPFGGCPAGGSAPRGFPPVRGDHFRRSLHELDQH